MLIVDRAEWKSYIIEMSMIYDFHVSTPLANISWIFIFHRFVSSSGTRREKFTFEQLFTELDYIRIQSLWAKLRGKYSLFIFIKSANC